MTLKLAKASMYLINKQKDKKAEDFKQNLKRKKPNLDPEYENRRLNNRELRINAALNQ